MFVGGSRDAARAFARSWWQLAVVQLLFTAALILVVGMVSAVFSGISADVFAWASANVLEVDTRIVAVATALGGAIAVFVLPVQLAAVAATASLADTVLAGRAVGVRASLVTGVRSTVRALAAAVVAVAVVVIALIGAPIISAVGFGGLLVLGVIALLRRAARSTHGHGPARWRTWIVLAIPFGALWWVSAPAILMIPAAVLERAWPVRAWRAADRVSTRTRWSIIGCWLLSVLATVLVIGALTWTGSLLGGDMPSAVIGGIAQLFALPVPIVTAVALYRRGAGSGGRVYPAASDAGPRATLFRTPVAPGAASSRIATLLVLALVVQTGAVMTVSTAAYAASGTVADQNAAVLTISVNTGADSVDAATLSTQRENCLIGTGDCSLRAALALAERAAADGRAGATIEIVGAPTISLLAPLTFAPDSLTPTGGGNPEQPGENPEPSPSPSTSPTPPIEGPGETPPGESPPSETPPSETAPSETPPAETPPSETPAQDTPLPSPAMESPAASGTLTGVSLASLVQTIRGAAAEEPAPPVTSTAPTIVRGRLDLIGGGAVLDGGGTFQILNVVSEYWDLGIQNMTLRNGSSSTFGGALLAGVPHTTLDATVFRTNTASYGAGAVFARNLTMTRSSFLDNAATGWNTSTLGGAIRATGTTVVTNATFSDNGIGDQFTRVRNQGSDIFTDADMTVVNSTFVGSRGGSLASPFATSTVRNSLFTSDNGEGAFLCAGRFTGANNFAREGDSSCPGTSGQNVRVPLLGPRDDTGIVPVFPIDPTGPALGAGADCPATDALGRQRPAQGCDLGAVQVTDATSVQLSVQPDPDVYGRATFRAAVASAAGATPRGTVTFTIGPQSYGPVPLADTAPTADGDDVATVVVSDLKAGQSYEYSASFAAVAPLADSSAGPLTYRVAQNVVPVSLSCAPSSAEVCASSTWVLDDTDSLPLIVSVDDDRDGSVVLAADPDGAQLLAGPSAVVGGTVQFELSAQRLGLGTRSLYAIYTSDDAQHIGTAAQQPVLDVRRAPTVTVTVPAAAAVFGDPLNAVANVSVTGAGPTPTGTVEIRGERAVLDGSGRATLPLSDANWGLSNVVVRYQGDAAYVPRSSNAVPFTLTPARTSTTIVNAQPQHPLVGQDVTLDVVVTTAAPSTAVPVGGVVLVLDGTRLSLTPVRQTPDTATRTVTASFMVPTAKLEHGAHTLGADFTGASPFAASAALDTELVVDSASTSTTLAISNDRFGWADDVTLTATVTGADVTGVPTGTVVFSAGTRTIGTAVLAACQVPDAGACAVATLTVPARSLGLGASSLGARYVGTDAFAASTAAPASATVDRATPTVNLHAPGSYAFGSAGSVGIQVSAGTLVPVNGTVRIAANDEVGGAIQLGEITLVDGEGSLALMGTELVPAAYTLSATFVEDSPFTSATATAPLVIEDARTRIVFDTVDPVSVPFNSTLDVGVTVSNGDNSLAPSGEVVLTWQGREVGRTTLAPSEGGIGGARHIVITARFGEPIPYIYAGMLTAEYVGAEGFADASVAPGPNSNQGRRPVTITPLQAVVSVRTDAVLGQTLGAEATVTLPGAPTGMTPEGQISFVVNVNGREYGPASATLVGGTAQLSDTFLRSIPVSQAGQWTVYATYVKTGTDNRYEATSPHDFTFHRVQLGAAAATVTATAPPALEADTPLTVAVRVDGVIAGSGTVWIQSADGSSVLRGEPVALVNGAATASLSIPSLFALGTDYTFAVAYSGDGSLGAAVSAPFTVRLTPKASSVQIGTDLAGAVPMPGFVGGKVNYYTRATTSSGPVEGYITLLRGTTQIATAQVDASGFAAFAVTPDQVWAGTIRAEFRPLLARVSPSAATLAHSWVAAPVAVALSSTSRTAIGEESLVRVSVGYDASRYPLAFGAALPSVAPSGTVEITDGQGAACTAYLRTDEQNARTSTAECALSYRTVGQRPLTATYSGSRIYEVASATRSVTVDRGTPTARLFTPGTTWVGLGTITVSWEVPRVDAGTITVLRGETPVCTSSVFSGSCDVTLPAFDLSRDGGVFTLRYSGSTLWNAASASVTGSLVACVPFGGTSSLPDGSASVTLSPSPTCGGGTGYRTTDQVYVFSVPLDGHRVERLADAAGELTGTNYLPQGSAQASTNPTLLVRDGVIQPWRVQARTVGLCIPVTIGTTGISDARVAREMLQWATQRECTTAPRVEGSSIVASLRVGSDFPVSIESGRTPARTQFVGWSGLTGAALLAPRTVFTIGADTTRIVANFSPLCYPLPSIVQPTGGRIVLDSPASNCYDPLTRTSGWTYGTPLFGELIDDGPGVRTYFDSWTGDTARFTVKPQVTKVNAQGQYYYPREFSTTITDQTVRIGASYGSCVALSREVRGDGSNGSAGSISLETPSNCPAGSGTEKQRWYKPGTAVSLSAVPGASGLRFLGWDGLDLTRQKTFENSATAVLTADTTARASFGTNANCRPISISAVPADGLALGVAWSLGENACSTMYGSRFYDQGIDGNGITVTATPTNATTAGSEIVFAWASSPPGSASGQAPSIGSVWTRQSELNEQFYGNSDVVAYACEFVAITASVRAPGGAFVATAGATNIDRASNANLANFLATPEADCGTGSDPRSGYGGYAWRAGTQLLPIVTADPIAYRFLGWGGDAVGAGETPDSPVALMGAGRRADGDYYHRRIDARFEAICYQLTVPSDTALVETVTAPNCPGVDASQRQYLGGTSVVVHATDSGDTLFRHWSSGTDAIDDEDARWASVTMTSNKSVVPYYSSKSIGEQMQTYGGQVGDILAVSAKKMVGVASAAMTSYIKLMVTKVTLVTDGIGYIAQGLEAMGIKGAVIDGMKSASSMMNSVISLLWAPFDCITAWSAGGQNTLFYAAQNLVATLAVGRLSQDAVQQQASAISTAQNSLSQLAANAQKLKKAVTPVVKTALSTLKAAKAGYEASVDGNFGFESNAYDAWGSQQSLSVYSTCMATRAGAAADTMDTSMRAVTGR